MKTKILIVGIGGVGGFFGGLLAKEYANSTETEITFLARGEHLKQIQANGLKVIWGKDSFFAHPHQATDNPGDAGVADYILICTKSYDLETTIQQLLPCIGPGTVLLPLLNGVDAVERIRKVLPETTVSDGCVYVISRLKEPGVVENAGHVQNIFFGIDGKTSERLLLLEKVLKEAGIEAFLSENISSIVWEKFIFISPIATATSYFDCSAGKLVEKHEATVMALAEEVKQIAGAKGISVSADIITKVLTRLRGMPYEATSSMHSDYKNNKQHTELASLTGYVVTAGKALNIPTPAYNFLYAELVKKLPL